MPSGCLPQFGRRLTKRVLAPEVQGYREQLDQHKSRKADMDERNETGDGNGHAVRRPAQCYRYAPAESVTVSTHTELQVRASSGLQWRR